MWVQDQAWRPGRANKGAEVHCQGSEGLRRSVNRGTLETNTVQVGTKLGNREVT